MSEDNLAESEIEIPEKKDSAPINEWEDLLGSGVIKRKIIKRPDISKRPESQDICIINYECRLEDDTLVEKQTSFEIILGDCDVVQGLDISIGLMDVGEICLLKIESRLAYGSKGLPPKIPENAVVVFNIELVSAENEEFEDLSIEQRKLRGNQKRERGNWWYGRGENVIAIQCYRRALDYLDEVEGGIKFSESTDVTDSTLQNLLEDRISVYNNMAAAQIKLESYEAALTSITTVLQCQPSNVKALFRQAKIYKAKNDIHLALKSLQKAADISPNDRDIENELSKLNRILDQHKQTERELAKRMFGDSLNTKNCNSVKNSKTTYLWATLAASLAVGLAGIVTYRFRFS